MLQALKVGFLAIAVLLQFTVGTVQAAFFLWIALFVDSLDHLRSKE